MTNEIVLPAGRRQLRCEVYAPRGDAKVPGVLILHEIFGLLDYVRDDARRLSEAGYLVIAPDLFSQGGQLSYCMKQFFTMDGLKNRATSTANQEIGDLLDALRSHTRCNGRLGMIGQCLSGGFVLQMARRSDLEAPVVFHHGLGVFGGGLPDADAAAIQHDVLGHFVEPDPMCPRSRVQKLAVGMGPRLQAHVYDGVGHGLRSVFRGTSQSNLAWQRTLTFFEQKLRS